VDNNGQGEIIMGRVRIECRGSKQAGYAKHGRELCSSVQIVGMKH